jgi:hypothetical protein
MKRLSFAPWLLTGIVVVLAGFFAGRALRPEKGAAYSFQASAPAYDAPKAAAGVDKAGLSGFAEDDSGRTVISGKVTAVGADSVSLQTASGSTNVIKLQPSAPLRQLMAADRTAILPGARVIVKLSGKDEAAAVLVLPAQ